MGFTASIVSAVLKSVVDGKLGSGLIKELADISIGGISEKGIKEITDFINRERKKIDKILLRESNNYVIVEIKYLLFRIEITDEVLRQCKYDSMNFSAFLWDKYRACKRDYIECESEIKRCLFSVADALIKLVRESEAFEKDVLIHISNSVDDTNVELKNISDFMKDNFDKLDNNSQIVLDLLLMILEQIQKINMQGNEKKSTIYERKKFKNNKKQKYIENWNSRLFLHIDNDENPITLEDAFIVPGFKYHIKLDRMKFLDKHSLTHAIKMFMEYHKTSNLLITGVPGIGKTSIISWIANKYSDNENVIILRFRDWSNKELLHGLLHAILCTLDCGIDDLDNKVIILDGFDEIKLVNQREKLIRELFNSILDFDNLKIIITSRTDYLKDVHAFENVFEILPFDIFQIKKFYQIIVGVELNLNDIDCENLDILGIPVILYMSIMAGINLTLRTTKAELYNRIFAEKGGIFDRFCFRGIGYDNGLQPLRDIGNVREYLKFLQNIAFLMFEKDELSLEKKECHEPELEFQGEKFTVMEFPIKHFLESSQNNIEFIHKSLYEYFVAQKISTSISEAIDSSKEKLSCILGKLFKNNVLSKEILSFLKYTIESTELSTKFYEVNEAFQLMIRNGMVYYTKMRYKNVIKCEICIFTNMLELIHLWEIRCLKYSDSFFDYIKCNKAYRFKLNLKDIHLNKLKIERDYLNDLYLQKFELNEMESISEEMMGIDLSGAHLSKANLNRASLVGANLKGAVLAEADLRQANLKRADLREADLTGADLRQVNLEGADLKGTNLESSSWFKRDLLNVASQLQEARFEYILVFIEDKVIKISKEDLFLNIFSK